MFGGVQIVFQPKSAKTQTQRVAAKNSLHMWKDNAKKKKNGCHCRQYDERPLSNIALDHVWVFSRIFMLAKVLAVISVHPCLEMEIRDNQIYAAVYDWYIQKYNIWQQHQVDS